MACSVFARRREPLAREDRGYCVRRTPDQPPHHSRRNGPSQAAVANRHQVISNLLGSSNAGEAGAIRPGLLFGAAN
jgi:hypothetical protein